MATQNGILALMQRGLLRWILLSVAVWIAAAIVPGIGYDRWQDLVIAALVLGILNTVVKPLLQLISLPIVVLTFGLFLLAINAFLLRLTAWLVTGFRVEGFWPAAGASLVISFVSFFLGHKGNPKRVVIKHSDSSSSNQRGPPPGPGPIIDV
jgi:putative membrane protein